MATQFAPLDLEAPSPKRRRAGGGWSGSGGGFGDFGDDEELASIMSGAISYPEARVDCDGPTKEQRQDPYAMTDTTQGLESEGIRVEDLAVANERGEAVGSYVAPKHMSIEEAYQSFVASKERPVQDFDVEIRNLLAPLMREIGLSEPGNGARKRKSSEEEGEDDELSSSSSCCSEGDHDPVKKAMQRLTEGGVGSAGLGRARGKKRKRQQSSPQEIQRREIDLLCTYGSAADRDYILSRFASEIKTANVDEKTLFTRLCPLCGFMDNTQDAVGNQEFQMIDRFADEGVGNMDADTHATLLAFLWNKRIYLPMRRRNLRVLPLTAKMARDHVTQPHRFNKRAELLNDIQDLRRAHRLLMATCFKRNGMTGELSYDKDRLLVSQKLMDQKWKLVGIRDDKDPFRTAHRVTGASAGTQTNPLQSVRRLPRNRR